MINEDCLIIQHDVLSSLQNQKNRMSYVLSNMSACIDKGLLRKNQEDSVLLLSHQNINDFKLLAVADGMGGLSHGAKASNMVLCELLKWFKQLSIRTYAKERNIYKELKQKLHEIDLIIRNKCNGGGTTLSVAIISHINTFFVNIGDSRIYITKGSTLNQISIDHSLSWQLFERGIIKTKEDIRFHKQNHLITSRLGCEKKMLKIDDFVLTNNDYDEIFLFTDGVTDCLSDKNLLAIINNDDISDLAVNIVDNSLTIISRRNDLDINEYYDIIIGGKDNSTVATFTKKRLNRRR